MRNLPLIFAVSLSLANSQGCVRLDEEGLDEQALLLSSEDSIVLCPIAATVAEAADPVIGVAWAAYPSDSDDLQLMFAEVEITPMGERRVIGGPFFVGTLEDEVAALSIQPSRDETSLFSLQAIGSDGQELLAASIARNGQITLGSSSVNYGAMLNDGCQTQVTVNNDQLTIFRGQLDGNLPLYLQ